MTFEVILIQNGLCTTRMPRSPSVTCEVITADDKKTTVYAVKVGDGFVTRKKFEEYEKFYTKIKYLLPATHSAPPKKRLLQPENKLVDKRKQWILATTASIVGGHHESEDVRDFYALESSDDDDDHHIDLGPSEITTVQPSDFEFMKTIGRGSFGRVFQVKHISTGIIYAMKVLSKEHIRKKNEVKHVMAERNVLKANIHHPFLVALHFSFQTKDKLYFVLDHLNGGELFSHLQREKHFSESKSRFYAAEIASALGYLHKNNIIYRDLKPENLLLDRYGYLVLTDFGLCKEGMNSKDTTQTFCGTPEYLAPEIILKKPYDRTVDWWCLGSVLYEMLFGLPPYYSKDHNEMYDRIVNQPLKLKHSLSVATNDMIIGLLQKDRTKRMGAKNDFEDIKNHAFFVTIDWEKLLKREMKAPFVPKINGATDDKYFAPEFLTEGVNQASLIPTKNLAVTVADHDFPGFTYVEANHYTKD